MPGSVFFLIEPPVRRGGVVLSADAAGFDDRLAEVAVGIGPAARAHPLDVTDPESVAAFAAAVPDRAVLVCNAGGALGLDPVVDIADEHGAECGRPRCSARSAPHGPSCRS